MFHFLRPSRLPLRCPASQSVPHRAAASTSCSLTGGGAGQSREEDGRERKLDGVGRREKETASQRVRGSERGLNGFQTGCTAEPSWGVKECEMWLYGDFVPGAFSAVCCVRASFSHFVGDENTIAQPQNANELIKNLTVNNAASSQVTQKEVCVCVGTNLC